MDTMRPFKIDIPQSDIDDLKRRLRLTRWPVPIAHDWSHGQPPGLIRDLVDYWLTGFDWRAQEARLNAYPQYLTEIDGQPIHFLHIRSPESNALPLILTHGWPSTVVEFLDVIGPLSDPRAHGLDPSTAFHLVIPSLPGFGFSTPLAGPRWEASRTAKAWDALMKQLDYNRYGAQGGDIGALVSRELGILRPPGLVGIHLQQIFVFPVGAPGEMEGLSPFEQAGFALLEKFQKHSGYSDIQSKRPATLAFGLADSPAAQLAWNAELFFGFEGETADRVDRDRFLTHVSIYWFTNCGGQAAEFYFENARTGAGYRDLPNPTPTGVATFPDDFHSVRNFARRANNIVHWSEMPRGGHFAASDEPALLVEDIRKFFGPLI
jgi:epoxide hydrolase